MDRETSLIRGHRWFPGVWFPVCVFAIWRMAHAAVTFRFGGNSVDVARYYDGAHYLRILYLGYGTPRRMMPSHAFFPGLSWVASPVQWLTGSDTSTVLIVTTLASLAAFVALWGVAREWIGERSARLAVVLFALFPSSLFLWTFYSESLFVALGAGAVWADRRGRRWIALACFAAVSTTRSIGIVVPIVIVLVRVVRAREIDKWAVGYLAAGIAGLGAVLVTMQIQLGDAFAFVDVQGDWGRTFSWPWKSVIQGVHNLNPRAGTVMVPSLIARNLDLWCVGIVIIGIGWMIVSKRPKFPVEAWLLGIALIALPLCSSVLASFNRFTLADWALFPAYASLINRLPGRWRQISLVAVVVVCVLTGYALLGRLTAKRFIG
jgi:Gpi18-like mannosyltransferase